MYVLPLPAVVTVNTTTPPSPITIRLDNPPAATAENVAAALKTQPPTTA